ncbi:MAG TPA: hypothetical protein VNY51_08735 [Candidatus Dormibacteraeota bacterium]|nr:hypothetical protein [Candidatus Dormibacteraeota bacterium]
MTTIPNYSSLTGSGNFSMGVNRHSSSKIGYNLGSTQESARLPMNKSVWRALIEVGFIIFLFYANLLMGEFERTGLGQKRGMAWALLDVFTAANFAIAVTASLIGYVLFEFLRKRF